MVEYFGVPRVELRKSADKEQYYYRHNRKTLRIRLPHVRQGQETCMEAWSIAKKACSEKPKLHGTIEANRFLGPMLRQYLKSRSKICATTRKRYNKYIKRIERFFGRIAIKDLTYELTEDFIESFEFASSATEHLIFLKAAYKWFVTKRYLPESDIQHVLKPEVNHEGFVSWTAADIKAFRNTHDENLWPRKMMEILLLTGCRVSDAIRLDHTNILDGSRLTYVSQKSGVPAALHIGNSKELFDHVTDTQPVFYHPRTLRKFSNEKQFRRLFKKACVAAGVQNTAHGLRVTAAHIYAFIGFTRYQLCSVLGWKKPETADHYVRKADRLRAAFAATENIFDSFNDAILSDL